MSRQAHDSRLAAILGCGALKVVVAGWLCGFTSPSYLLCGLGAAAVVPRLVGSYDTFMMLVSLCPDILFVYLLSSHIPARLSAEVSIAFPRIGSRRRWALIKCQELALCVFLYELVSALLLNAVEILVGEPMQWGDRTLGSSLCVALSGLFCIAWVLLVNLIALRREALVGFACVTGVHLGALLCLCIMPAQMAKTAANWVISARGTPAWHSQIGDLFGASSDVAANISPAVSALVLVALILVLCAALAREVNQMDLM